LDRFLVGYDGSSLASRSGGHVAAIVVDPGRPLDIPIGIRSLSPRDTAGLAAEASRLLRALRVPATVEVRAGDPADVLVATAAAGGHQLIALGHHGRGALREMLLGSVAKRVLARAPCPTLVAGKRAPSALGRILVALGGSPQSEAACDAAIALGRICDARALLLNVVDTTALRSPRHAEVMAHLRVSGEREGVQLLAAATRRCARGRRAGSLPGARPRRRADPQLRRRARRRPRRDRPLAPLAARPLHLWQRRRRDSAPARRRRSRRIRRSD